VKDITATVTSKGQLVVPAEIRRKHGIAAGTKIKFLEDQFGRIVLQPLTAHYVDRIMGCLAEGPDMLAAWEIEHRAEGERER
jgi:AbrB family looped-hinge helix DNA binding protein